MSDVPPDRTTPSGPSERPARIYRSRRDRMIAGVCGGLAEYLGVDPALIRIATVVLALFTAGTVIIAYIIALILIPEAGEAGAVARPDDEGSGGMTAQQGRLILGTLLVIFGVVWSLTVLIPGIFDPRVLLPLALIALGAMVLFQGRR